MGKETKVVKKGAAKSAKRDPKATSKKEDITVCLECHEGSADKFYRLLLDGTNVISTYGRCGTDGQESIKSFPTEGKVRYHLMQLKKKSYAISI